MWRPGRWGREGGTKAGLLAHTFTPPSLQIAFAWHAYLVFLTILPILQALLRVPPSVVSLISSLESLYLPS